jgi:hypothetical protein
MSISLGEIIFLVELLEWIKKYYPSAGSTRKIISPKEIDIYIPELKLGIEYCGLYWHSELNIKNKKYHQDKMIECNKKGIRLITIFEDEWVNRQNQVKNFLKSVMGVNKIRLYARNCFIKEIDPNLSRKFLEENHIQGKAPLKISYGIFYKDNLMGVMTGNTHHRKPGIFTLNRLAFQNGVQIIGGSSKLLKRLISYAKKNGYKKIISWSDNRWSEGGVYEKCGFKMAEELLPDYSYYTGQNIRQSKQSNKKANLLKKGAEGSMENTEKELSLSLGYSRIWDCGKKRWEFSL